MSKYCLSSFTGTGTEIDPYRPLGLGYDIPGWAIIDFRPDSTVVDGFCIGLYPDNVTLPKGTIQIATSKIERLSSNVLSSFSNKIGLNLTSTNFDEILLELLTSQATPPADKTRWNPIAPTKDKRFEIWMGQKIVDIPFVAGGAVYTESFNKADGAGWGPDLTWTAASGAIKTVTSTGANGTTNSYCLGRTTANNTATDDNYTQMVVVSTTTSSSSIWGVVCRYTDTTGFGNGYEGRQGDATTQANTNLNKLVSGIRTQLSTSTNTHAANDVLKVTANGSTITFYVNGVSNIATTDTAVTTGKNAMAGIRQSGTTGIGFDSLEYGDLVVNATATPSAISTPITINTANLNSLHGATAVTTPISMPAPTVLASSTAAPSAITQSISMPAVSAFNQIITTPSSIMLAFSMPTPTVTGDSVVVPSSGDEASLRSGNKKGSIIGKVKT